MYTRLRYSTLAASECLCNGKILLLLLKKKIVVVSVIVCRLRSQFCAKIGDVFQRGFRKTADDFRTLLPHLWKLIVTKFKLTNVIGSLVHFLSRSLPLKKLWVWLVSVACCQTGQQRLMATGLLLRLLLVVSG